MQALLHCGLQLRLATAHPIGAPRRGAALQVRVARVEHAQVAELRGDGVDVAVPYSAGDEQAITYSFGAPNGVAASNAISNGSSSPKKRSSVTKPSEIAELLMEREQALRELLTPGRGLPPRASVVAALRKEISGLRQQLRLEIAGAPAGGKLELPPQERWGDAVAGADAAAPVVPARRPNGGWHMGANPNGEEEDLGDSWDEDDEEEEAEEVVAEGEPGAIPQPKRRLPDKLTDRNRGISQGRQSSLLDAINCDDSSGASLMPVQAKAAAESGAAARMSKALRLVEARLAASGGGGAAAPNISTNAAATTSSEGVAAALGISSGALEAAWAVPSGVDVAGAAVQAAITSRRQRGGVTEGEEAVEEEGVLPTSAEALQLEVLQMENAQLRAQAEALLVREAQLRDMYHRALLAATGSDYTLAEEEEGLAEEGLTGEAQPEVVAEGQ